MDPNVSAPDNVTDSFVGNDTEPFLTYEAQIVIDKYTTPVLYLIGFPGNIISLVVWLQRRMRHSSGCYLAALALDDLIFLALHVIFELEITWQKDALSFPFVCEVYPVVFLASQYLSPFLVLGFTTERYISICHPFKREQYCTVRRAKIVIVSLVVAILLVNAPHAYFYHLDNVNNRTQCTQRAEVVVGGMRSIVTVYNSVVDMVAFCVVPGTVLVLNILVIREMKRISSSEHAQLQGPPQRSSATTVMLLAVSFYQIITTLPVSIAYIIWFEFNYDSIVDVYGKEEAARRHRIYFLFLSVIKEYGITHYAFNIFIYLITGKMFREEVKKIFLRPFAKLASRLPGDYSSLRTSVRGTDRTWVSVNGNGNSRDAKNRKNETLL